MTRQMLCVVTVFTDVFEIVPVQRHVRIVDIIRRKMRLMMDDVTQLPPAALAHAAVLLDAIGNKRLPAAFPPHGVIEFFRPRLCHVDPIKKIGTVSLDLDVSILPDTTIAHPIRKFVLVF